MRQAAISLAIRFELKAIPAIFGFVADTWSIRIPVRVSKAALHHISLRIDYSHSQLGLERHTLQVSINAIVVCSAVTIIVIRNHSIQLLFSFSCMTNKSSGPAGTHEAHHQQEEVPCRDGLNPETEENKDSKQDAKRSTAASDFSLFLQIREGVSAAITSRWSSFCGFIFSFRCSILDISVFVNAGGGSRGALSCRFIPSRNFQRMRLGAGSHVSFFFGCCQLLMVWLTSLSSLSPVVKIRNGSRHTVGFLFVFLKDLWEN
mmetsp:Transcript_128940/g.373069  ORF Transcript_128940/g.373069 Transcript_128940/m.373069 type:complete len:261 (-) Transcript_128940:137-919(-)